MPHPTAHLSAWAARHPEGRLTNAELIDRVDTTEAWLDERIGIRERRVAGPGESAATLGAGALEATLVRAGLAATDLDLLVVANTLDDHAMPSTAARIGALLGTQAFGFDVQAACSGWLVALETARAFLETGRADTIAVVATDQTTLAVDPLDRQSVVFFGDGAAAALLTSAQPAEGLEVVGTRWRAANDHHAAVVVPYAGAFAMDAKVTRPWVEEAMVSTAQDLLADHGVAPGDLAGLVAHQANLRLIERFAAALGVAPERHWHNVEWAGNTWAAGAPSALAEGLDRDHDRLADGDHVLVVTVGAGLNVVATLFRWSAR